MIYRSQSKKRRGIKLFTPSLSQEVTAKHSFQIIVTSQTRPGKKLYFANSSCEWGIIKDICLRYHLHASMPATENYYRQLSIELSVLGGEIYRMLMGDHQPKNYAAQATHNDSSVFFRLSSIVSNLNEENIFENAGNALLVNDQFTLTPLALNAKKPVIGALFQSVIAFFLDDRDLSNFGAVDENELIRVIRFDPECCFSEEFWTNDEKSILFNMQQIVDRNQDCTDYSYYDQGLYHFQFKSAAFSKKEQFDDAARTNTEAHFSTLFHSSWRRFEVYAALARLIELPWENYEQLITQHLNHQFKNEIEFLEETIKARLTLFKKCAFNLLDFTQFYANYTAPSPIRAFWQQFYCPKNYSSLNASLSPHFFPKKIRELAALDRTPAQVKKLKTHL